MMLPVNVPQPVERYVRINLRGGDVRMSQNCLHGAQVGAVFNHVGRAAMAQHMRTRLAVNFRFPNNPPDAFAGKLIEDAGLKGSRSGGAEISAQHANFIVNPGGATAADVYALLRQAQTAVCERTGIWLRPEIELFGRWTTEEREAVLGGVVSHG